MKLFLCLVTPDEALRRFFGRGKDAVIPAEALKRGAFVGLSPQVITVAWAPEVTPRSADLDRFMLHRGRDAQACILLLDRTWTHLTVEIRNAAFCGATIKVRTARQSG